MGVKETAKDTARVLGGMYDFNTSFAVKKSASTCVGWSSFVKPFQTGTPAYSARVKETAKDTARVLGGMYDGIEYRGFSQRTIEEIAEYAGVPDYCVHHQYMWNECLHKVFLILLLQLKNQQALVLGTQMGVKETAKDTARVLGGMYDGIEYRGFSQRTIEPIYVKWMSS
jgi:ornithine carbamoyltransferase